MSGVQGLFWNPGSAPHLPCPIPVDHNTHGRGESPECLQRDTPLKVTQPFNRLTEHLPCAEPLRSCPVCPQPSRVPTFLRVKTQILLCAQGPEPPALTSSLSQPHELPSCSSSGPGMVLPQDLYICSTLHWECSSPSSVHCSLTYLPSEASPDLSKGSL